ncbi:MAG: nucleotidyltransferase domain-containing protein [Chloroflexi bacterium]|nr:nucleotidyltransferase domain-containing protein [Chloroflexota bacterium]
MVRTPAQVRRLIREYVRALESMIQVERVILYGSYARGTPHEWSDIDVAVISRDFASKDQWSRQTMLAKADGVNPALRGAMIESLGYSVGEYTRAHRQSFLGEIKRTGKTVYKRRSPRKPNHKGQHRRA